MITAFSTGKSAENIGLIRTFVFNLYNYVFDFNHCDDHDGIKFLMDIIRSIQFWN